MKKSSNKRPKWRAGRRDEIRNLQGNFCAECGDDLNDDFQIHHVTPWNEIKAVGLEYFDTVTANPRLKGDMMRALMNDDILDGRADGRNLEAVHPHCHQEIHRRLDEKKKIEQGLNRATR